QVWAFVTDGANATKWRSGVLDVTKVSGQGVGETWKQGVKGPGGRRIDADYEVTAWEPEARMAFKAIAGPVRPTGEYRFAAEDGGTRLSFSLQAELSGLKKLLMGGPVQSTMDAEMGALDRLKAVLEGS
ncbi:MAG TPA: SRPBCC family protein, partial [Candidatus Binatus sp.]|nr:SRPBCC family protein [Candidatus Binatus sp.]